MKARENVIRILTLNILAGGGKRVSAIVDFLAKHSADILVITEFRENKSGDELQRRLKDCGWMFQSSSNPPRATNGVLVASRIVFENVSHQQEIPEGKCRWIECQFTTFRLVGVYFPHGIPKLNSWPWFIEAARSRSNNPCVIVGDFNTGLHFIDEEKRTFRVPEYMNRMKEIPFIDAWRHFHSDKREYTWFSQRQSGFRLDYVFLSSHLVDHLVDVRHLHEPRETKASDHSALIVQIKA